MQIVIEELLIINMINVPATECENKGIFKEFFRDRVFFTIVQLIEMTQTFIKSLRSLC